MIFNNRSCHPSSRAKLTTGQALFYLRFSIIDVATLFGTMS